MAIAVTIVFTSWRKGREEVRKQLYTGLLPLDEFLADLDRHPIWLACAGRRSS